MTDLDAPAETTPRITLAALDDLASDAVDIGLLVTELKTKIETLRRKLAPTAGDDDVDEPQPSRLYFG